MVPWQCTPQSPDTSAPFSPAAGCALEPGRVPAACTGRSHDPARRAAQSPTRRETKSWWWTSARLRRCARLGYLLAACGEDSTCPASLQYARRACGWAVSPARQQWLLRQFDYVSCGPSHPVLQAVHAPRAAVCRSSPLWQPWRRRRRASRSRAWTTSPPWSLQLTSRRARESECATHDRVFKCCGCMQSLGLPRSCSSVTLPTPLSPAPCIRGFRVLLCRLTLTPWAVRAQINIEYNIRCVRYMFSNFYATGGWRALG